MKNKYIFPAIFKKEEKGYSISFPDLPGAFTCGKDLKEAMYMAKDCLNLYLDGMKSIPKRRNIESIELGKDEEIFMIESN